MAVNAEICFAASVAARVEAGSRSLSELLPLSSESRRSPSGTVIQRRLVHYQFFQLAEFLQRRYGRWHTLHPVLAITVDSNMGVPK